MTFVLSGFVVLLMVLGASDPGQARQRRSGRELGREITVAPRLPDPSFRPADPNVTDGIIHWNTPNKDGNLGGPGAGGSSGS